MTTQPSLTSFRPLILLILPLLIIISPLLLFPSWTSLVLTTLLLIILLIFLTTRHIQLKTRQNAPLPAEPHDYRLFVLGSGGHTKEMLMMMDDGFCDMHGLHRRYIVSSGDSMSENHLIDYESDLAALCSRRGTDSGSFDVRFVTRARRVHQSLLSTPFTALLSILDIFPALVTPPANAKLSYPTTIYSNGPATGFFVGLAAHLLKMFYLVPEDTMRIVYIESWARISTLSLTGKLFYYTGIAEVFLVQHKEVAARYGVRNGGEMVFNARREDIDL